jgi:hypothetical protein
LALALAAKTWAALRAVTSGAARAMTLVPEAIDELNT